MRKELRRLTLLQLQTIGQNFSIYSEDKTALIDRLTAYFNSYDLSWQDVAHRFQLKNGDKK